MDRLARMVGDKVGDMVEGAVKNALGIEDKKKEKKGGGLVSFFGGDKDKEKEKEKEKEKGGIFSFGDDKKKKKDDDEGFFSKVFHKRNDDDEDKGMKKKSGFDGLFAEGPEGAGGEHHEEETGESGGDKESKGQVDDCDKDLLEDLMEVAAEISMEK